MSARAAAAADLPPRIPGAPDAERLRVAVIGAGVAGLACARRLADDHCDVVVLDRGRGVGGRLSTRRTTAVGPFDHGAPFFTVTDPRFGRFVRAWQDDGVCASWPARLATWRAGELDVVDAACPLIVGTPGMNAVCRHLAGDLDVRTGVTVTGLRRRDDGWRLVVDSGAESSTDERPFDAVVVATPPPQARRLVAGVSDTVTAGLAGLVMRPRWVGLLALDTALGGVLDTPDVIEIVDDAIVRRLVRDDTKPGRVANGRARWVVHARSGWSAERFDTPREVVADDLLDAARRVLATTMGTRLGRDGIVFGAAHRWGLASSERPEAALYTQDRTIRLLVCGDAFGGGGTDRSGVEAAFLSGYAAATIAIDACLDRDRVEVRSGPRTAS